MSVSAEGTGTRTCFDPRRYHESVTGERGEVAERPPVCLYLEVTNRCNLLCIAARAPDQARATRSTSSIRPPKS